MNTILTLSSVMAIILVLETATQITLSILNREVLDGQSVSI